MSHFIFWYLTITILGLATFPLVYRLMSALPDRGYAFARAGGLLLWGYVFWILGVLGMLRNDLGGLLFSFGLLLGASIWAGYKTGWDELLSWLRGHLREVITTEILFALAFLGWAFVRSNNPEIMGTEKPMELAFINAILRSDTFPPHDPWLSGHAISYYYFGYVMVAMLAKLTATTGSVAFNLGLSLVFALSALGVYGLVYNLLVSERRENRNFAFLAALLGPFFTLIVSNWEGFLHYIHSQGLFWHAEAGQMVSGFWRWLGIWTLVDPPTGNEFGHWWWWRASRIVLDVDFSGYEKEVISEFPFFSYLLGDLHPHVLAMPFAFVCLAMTQNLFNKRESRRFHWLGLFHLELSPLAFGAIALAVGGMSFLNTWDFPIYVAIVAGAYSLRNLLDVEAERASLGVVLGDFFSMGLALGVTGVLLYLPFFIGFSSQAGGFIPNAIYITRGAHLWVVFGPLFVPIFLYLFYLWTKHGSRERFARGVSLGLGLVVALLGILLLLLLGMAILAPVLPKMSAVEQLFLGSLAAPNLKELILEGFRRRVVWPGAWLTLTLLAALTLGLLWKDKYAPAEKARSLPPTQGFVLLLALWGALLALVPEFIFLRDLFGYRINTIFKFYYQAWLLWSVVAAYGSVMLLRKLRSGGAFLFLVGLLVVLGMALVYPVKGLWSKTSAFSPSEGRTLDGAAYFERSSPDDAAAAEWLRQAPFGVIAEAGGGSYTSSARMAIYSGLPAVLGWDFHEVQWRGDSQEVTPRQSDIAALYCTPHWETALSILHKYDIRYVVVGSLEYSAYPAGESGCPNGLQEAKFIQNLPLAARFGQTVIYGNE